MFPLASYSQNAFKNESRIRVVQSQRKDRDKETETTNGAYTNRERHYLLLATSILIFYT